MLCFEHCLIIFHRCSDALTPQSWPNSTGRNGVAVVDDSYDGNPALTVAAWRTLAALGQGWRILAVLGHTAELGEYERAAGDEVVAG